MPVLHMGRALRPREPQPDRKVTADGPDGRARDREGLVADFAVQRRLDPLPFLPRSEFEADGAGRERLHQEQCGITRLAFRQERLFADRAELAFRMLDPDRAAQGTDRLVSQLEAQTVSLGA